MVVCLLNNVVHLKPFEPNCDTLPVSRVTVDILQLNKMSLPIDLHKF